MLKIKMYSIYEHFPELVPQPGEKYINCYSDAKIFECTTPGKNIALMLEPRSMMANKYEYVRDHAELFDYIFTHDSELLQLPQARFLNWADVWLTTDSPKKKNISICTSFKNWCPLHCARLDIANYYKDRPEVDVFYGDWNNPEIPEVKAKDYLENYKYSIAIENDNAEYWYTEKILNCFATKTVPIYVGSPKISEKFNPDGIIFVSNWRDIPGIINHLDVENDYARRLDAINDNFERVKPYNVSWKKRFIRDYGGILEELQNE